MDNTGKLVDQSITEQQI